MKYNLYSKDYSYTDKDGTIHPSHTCTDADQEHKPSGADLMYTVDEGGDHTRCHKKVLSIGALGAGRISG